MVVAILSFCQHSGQSSFTFYSLLVRAVRTSKVRDCIAWRRVLDPKPKLINDRGCLWSSMLRLRFISRWNIIPTGKGDQQGRGAKEVKLGREKARV